MKTSTDPAFRPGDVVDFTGSATNVVLRTNLESNHNHVTIVPQTIGVIIYIERHPSLKNCWYGILINGTILWLSALLQGIIIRKVNVL